MSILLNNEQDEIDAMMHPKANAYHNIYLETMDELHQFLYVTFLKQDKDYFSLVDTYNMYSELRSYMDKGSQIALNSGHKQCLRSIPQEYCLDKPKVQNIEKDIARWMGSVYNYMQWKYNITSQEICEHIPAKELFNLYESLKEKNKEEIVGYLYQTYVL